MFITLEDNSTIIQLEKANQLELSPFVNEENSFNIMSWGNATPISLNEL